MSRDFDFAPRARADIRRIVRWLEKLSPKGANSWLRAMWRTAMTIVDDADRGASKSITCLRCVLRKSILERGKMSQVHVALLSRASLGGSGSASTGLIASDAGTSFGPG